MVTNRTDNSYFFTTNKKATPLVTLVCSADFNAEYFQSLIENNPIDKVVAVDGGYHHIQSCNAKAHVAVGDFDSLGYVPRDVETIVYPTQKDESDFDLALLKVSEWYPHTAVRVYVFGALGGRLDHNQGAINIAAKYAKKGMDIQLIGNDMALKIMNGPEEFFVPQNNPGSIVSVFAFSDVCEGVTETGMKYLLNDSRLENTSSLGLSNEQTLEQAVISLKKGQLSVFYQL